MSALNVDLRKDKMIHIVKKSLWEKTGLTFAECCDNHLISWRDGATSSNCGISSLLHQSQKPAIFVFFQLPSLFSHPTVYFLQEEKGAKWELHAIVLRGVRDVRNADTWIGGSPVLERIVRRCLMKTFGHCRTLVSGQCVDTCCQELNGTTPSSRDMRSGGSYINTASWPRSLTPGAPRVSCVP